MAKKKKKLIKYNQSIRKIFSGLGFDEGIVKVPLDNLIELAMILSLKERHLTQKDLVRAMRRIWSEGKSADRAVITEYLQSLNLTFDRTKNDAYEDERENKIDEILGQIEHTEAEEIKIKEHFTDARLKKITSSRIQKALQKIRENEKLNAIEQAFDGIFDENGDFIFFHSFAFDFDTLKFHKILQLKIHPFGDGIFKTSEENIVEEHIQQEKDEAIKAKQSQIERFISQTASSNRYMDIQTVIKMIKKMPETSDLNAIEIDDSTVVKIISNIYNIDHLESTKTSFRLFKYFSTDLFENNDYNIEYSVMLEIQKIWLYKAIWANEELPIKQDLESENRGKKAAFKAEMDALKDALVHEADGLGIKENDINNIIAKAIQDAVMQNGILEIPYKTLKNINRHFSKQIENLKLKKQREELLAKTIRDFKNLFPLARSMNRKLIFHVGPTNSGKTYAAFEHMKKADTAYYLAPLRLLALEGYETLKESDILASLVTGEEQIIDEEAAHISSTIEMANFQVDVEVCVIDEVQMIADKDRGWAWANAIIGIPASTVIMTGSEDALNAVKELAQWLEEPLEIVRFERKAPLIMQHHPTSLKKIPPHSAIVAFSRRDVLTLKEQLGKWHNVSVVYGNLSPEVRREEARRFREGESQILVSTDAIAMGLNLPIKTILFARDSKFDGQSRRLLTSSEIRQISGRAGRFGLHEEGFVGALTRSVLETVTTRIDAPSPMIKGPYKVMANFEHIELISSITETKSLAKILGFFVKNMRFDGPFEAANIENMLEIAQMVDMYELDLKSKYYLSCAPMTLGSAYLESVFHRYLNALERKEAIPFTLPQDLPSIAQTADTLFHAEEMVKEVSLYLWLSYRFSENFIDVENAVKSRQILNRFIEKSLKNGIFAKTCKRCGRPLPANSKFRICQSCYEGGRTVKRYQKRR